MIPYTVSGKKFIYHAHVIRRYLQEEKKSSLRQSQLGNWKVSDNLDEWLNVRWKYVPLRVKREFIIPIRHYIETLRPFMHWNTLSHSVHKEIKSLGEREHEGLPRCYMFYFFIQLPATWMYSVWKKNTLKYTFPTSTLHCNNKFHHQFVNSRKKRENK